MLLDALRKHCRLRNLAIIYCSDGSHNTRTQWHEITIWPSLYGFKNLRTLDLSNLSGDLSRLSAEIADVLCESKQLKSLSISTEALHNLRPDLDFTLLAWKRSEILCFRRNLQKYIARRREKGHSGPLLHLEQLSIGMHMDLDQEGITQLTDLDSLKRYDQFYYPTYKLGHKLSLRSAKARPFPNLKRISVYWPDKDVSSIVRETRKAGSAIDELEMKGMLGDHDCSPQHCSPYSELGFHWKKLFLGTHPTWNKHLHTHFENWPRNFEDMRETFLSKCHDLEELYLRVLWPATLPPPTNEVCDEWVCDVPHIHQRQRRPEQDYRLTSKQMTFEKLLPEIPKLRIWLNPVGAVSIIYGRSSEQCLEFAKYFFRLQRAILRKRGFASQLRFLGLGDSLYTILWTQEANMKERPVEIRAVDLDSESTCNVDYDDGGYEVVEISEGPMCCGDLVGLCGYFHNR